MQIEVGALVAATSMTLSAQVQQQPGNPNPYEGALDQSSGSNPLLRALTRTIQAVVASPTMSDAACAPIQGTTAHIFAQFDGSVTTTATGGAFGMIISYQGALDVSLLVSNELTGLLSEADRSKLGDCLQLALQLLGHRSDTTWGAHLGSQCQPALPPSVLGARTADITMIQPRHCAYL